jgi:hypothetical protein
VRKTELVFEQRITRNDFSSVIHDEFQTYERESFQGKASACVCHVKMAELFRFLASHSVMGSLGWRICRHCDNSRECSELDASKRNRIVRVNSRRYR